MMLMRLRRTLLRDIAIVLAIKAVLLFALWALFFSHPSARHMRMPDAQVERHLLPAIQPSALHDE